MNPPTLAIVAGANGSGKSTLTFWNSDIFRALSLLDPDKIGRMLQSTLPSTYPIAAARQVLKSAGDHVSRGESFAVETTLSGKSYLQLMADARSKGFEIVVVYIGTKRGD